MSAALSICGVGLTYPTRSGQTEALSDVDVEIGEGEFVALLGPRDAENPRCCRLPPACFHRRADTSH